MENCVNMLSGGLDLSAVLQSGVYILLHKGRIVYVGKSRMVLKRLYAHRNLWERKRRGLRRPGYTKINGVPFDKVMFHPCRYEELDALELKLIQEHRPQYNVRLQPRERIEAPLDVKVLGKVVTINKAKPPLPRLAIGEPLRRLKG